MLLNHRAACAAALAVAVAACSKPEPPRVTPRTAAVSAIGPAGFTVQLQLDVFNPNKFPLLARSVTGTLELGSGAVLGQGQAAPNGTIPANSTSIVPATISMPWNNLAVLAPYALSGAPVPYRFRGTATIGGEKLNVDVPFELQGELTRAQVLEAGTRALNAR